MFQRKKHHKLILIFKRRYGNNVYLKGESFDSHFEVTSTLNWFAELWNSKPNIMDTTLKLQLERLTFASSTVKVN